MRISDWSSDVCSSDLIEVLKGPQGTLFGRNATGGVIQVVTLEPQQEFGGKVSVGYGNYNTYEGKGYITGGLANGIAADLSVSYENRGDGFGRNFRSEAHTSELQSLMRTSYAVFC